MGKRNTRNERVTYKFYQECLFFYLFTLYLKTKLVKVYDHDLLNQLKVFKINDCKSTTKIILFYF